MRHQMVGSGLGDSSQPGGDSKPEAGAGTASSGVAVAAGATGAAAMSFFMHDILGGTRPTTRAVTDLPHQWRHSTPHHLHQHSPFLADSTVRKNSAILQNNGNGAVTGGGNQPFVTAGNLPAGSALQQLMFGSLTVIDDELTVGHELGSGVIGRAQGFYLASSLDGTSHTFAFTAMPYRCNTYARN
uniref:Dirigent protein n=1 Tax=Kalanchoe fedtschenkoi TaxID=63787 RepID=A0A7N0VG57_KALFE